MFLQPLAGGSSLRLCDCNDPLFVGGAAGSAGGAATGLLWREAAGSLTALALA